MIKLYKSTIGNGAIAKFDGTSFSFKTGLFEHERIAANQVQAIGTVKGYSPDTPRWVGILKSIGGIALFLLLTISGWLANVGFLAGGVIGVVLLWKGSILLGLGALVLGAISQFVLPAVMIFIVASISGLFAAALGVFAGIEPEGYTKFICVFNDSRGFVGATDTKTYAAILAAGPRTETSFSENAQTERI
jgi:hypothetical protein